MMYEEGILKECSDALEYLSKAMKYCYDGIEISGENYYPSIHFWLVCISDNIENIQEKMLNNSERDV